MKQIVLGTAGHVDHGKTLLTKVLTGVDTDRLAEEKRRGITIELGFASMPLSNGDRVAMIDVPGHERFVKTMMAGAAGMDGVLLTVAADDGVMPQTVEHLDIIRLLGIQSGLWVITKCDLADEARITEVEEQVRGLAAGSPLADAPILRVSAASGAGIPALKSAIEGLVESLRQRGERQPLRLPVDRVFQTSGFGAVASGTLTEGEIRMGDEIELYPQGITGRVRSLQNHNRQVERLGAGMRTALSLTAEARAELARGCTIAQPDSMLVTAQLDVWLQITPGCAHQIKNASQLHLFHGTREVVCKLRLLDAERLTAGQSGYAQLKLAQPLAIRYGDRFILRFFSPVVTIGGGVILAGNPRRLRRSHPPVLERLERLNSGDAAVRLLCQVEDAGLEGIEPERLRRLRNQSPEEFRDNAAELLTRGEVVELSGNRWVAKSALEGRWRQVEEALAAYHAEYPLQPGIPRAELSGRLFPERGELAEEVLAWMSAQGKLTWKGGYAALPGFEPVFTQEHKIMQRKLLHYYRDAWFLAPNQKDVDAKFEKRGAIYRQVLANMRITGKLIPLTPRYAVHFEAHEEALSIFRGLFAHQSNVTLGEFRTAAGISRKYAQLFLEYWDRQGISRRVGDGRVLLK